MLEGRVAEEEAERTEEDEHASSNYDRTAITARAVICWKCRGRTRTLPAGMIMLSSLHRRVRYWTCRRRRRRQDEDAAQAP